MYQRRIPATSNGFRATVVATSDFDRRRTWQIPLLIKQSKHLKKATDGICIQSCNSIHATCYILQDIAELPCPRLGSNGQADCIDWLLQSSNVSLVPVLTLHNDTITYFQSLILKCSRRHLASLLMQLSHGALHSVLCVVLKPCEDSLQFTDPPGTVTNKS